MSEAAEQEVLKRYKDCKHSVRYDNSESKILRSIYVPRDAVIKLGNPDKIKVTIEKAD